LLDQALRLPALGILLAVRLDPDRCVAHLDSHADFVNCPRITGNSGHVHNLPLPSWIPPRAVVLATLLTLPATFPVALLGHALRQEMNGRVVCSWRVIKIPRGAEPHLVAETLNTDSQIVPLRSRHVRHQRRIVPARWQSAIRIKPISWRMTRLLQPSFTGLVLDPITSGQCRPERIDCLGGRPVHVVPTPLPGSRAIERARQPDRIEVPFRFGSTVMVGVALVRIEVARIATRGVVVPDICLAVNRRILHRRHQHQVTRHAATHRKRLVFDIDAGYGRYRAEHRHQADGECCESACAPMARRCRHTTMVESLHGNIPCTSAQLAHRIHHLATTLACRTTTARSPFVEGLWLRAKILYMASCTTDPPPPPYCIDPALEPRPSSSWLSRKPMYCT